MVRGHADRGTGQMPCDKPPAVGLNRHIGMRMGVGGVRESEIVLGALSRNGLRPRPE